MDDEDAPSSASDPDALSSGDEGREAGEADLPLDSEELDDMLGIAPGADGAADARLATKGPEPCRSDEDDEQQLRKGQHKQASTSKGNGLHVDAPPKGGAKAKRRRQEAAAAEHGQEDAGREEGVGAAREGLGPAGPSAAAAPKIKPVLSRERLLRMQAKAEARGVVYLSRIPPHMKPAKVRQLLGVHGELGRVYLAPAATAAERRERRRTAGKTGKRDTGKSFAEGWVEFEDKRVAKRVAAQLNGQPMGGKKRSSYYFDLWCLKYLPKFRWDHLTEEINYQRAVREQRLAIEISAAKRERDFYLSRVDRAKAVEAIRKRKRAKLETGEGAGPQAEAAAPAPAAEGGTEGVRGRMFRQRRSRAEGLEEGAGALPDDVLGLVAARKG